MNNSKHFGVQSGPKVVATRSQKCPEFWVKFSGHFSVHLGGQYGPIYAFLCSFMGSLVPFLHPSGPFLGYYGAPVVRKTRLIAFGELLRYFQHLFSIFVLCLPATSRQSGGHRRTTP